MTTTPHRRSAIGALYAGLGLTAAAMAAAYADHGTTDVLAGHIRAGYPAYSQARIDAAVMDLVVKDTSGDTGLPPLLGWAGMLPSLAGLVAVALLWRRQ